MIPYSELSKTANEFSHEFVDTEENVVTYGGDFSCPD